MNYYLIELTTYMDTTPDAKGIYGYATMDEAVANFHTKLGGAMKNANYKSECVVVITNTGTTVKSEYWARSAEVEE